MRVFRQGLFVGLLLIGFSAPALAQDEDDSEDSGDAAELMLLTVESAADEMASEKCECGDKLESCLKKIGVKLRVAGSKFGRLVGVSSKDLKTTIDDSLNAFSELCGEDDGSDEDDEDEDSDESGDDSKSGKGDGNKGGSNKKPGNGDGGNVDDGDNKDGGDTNPPPGDGDDGKGEPPPVGGLPDDSDE